MTQFRGRVGIQQLLLPEYRVPFFQRLAGVCSDGLELFVSQEHASEAAHTATEVEGARVVHARITRLGSGPLRVVWQHGYAKWLRSADPDVVVVSANIRILSNLFGARVMRRLNKPVIGWGLGCLHRSTGRLGALGRKTLLRRFMESYDAIIAYSKKAAEDYMRLGVPRNRVFVAPNSVSTEAADAFLQRLDGNPSLLAAWRRNLGLSDDPIVLFVGRLTPPKRVDCLLRACKAASRPLQLVIVGEGPERHRLDTLGKTLGVTTFFCGHQTGDQLAACFSAADLFVLPGPGGLAIQEAMAYGKPVIVGSGDGVQFDLVREGANGFHVREGDVGQLTRLLDESLADMGRLREMGKLSRAIVKNDHNLNRMVEGFSAALAFVSSARGARGEKAN